MRKLCLLAAAIGAFVLLALTGLSGRAQKKNDGWIPLFNGKDLSGFTTFFEGRDQDGKVDDLIQVQDGVLHVYPEGKDGAKKPRGYFATTKAYSYFQLRFEFKRGTRPPGPLAAGLASHLTYHAVGNDPWPHGIRCLLTEGSIGTFAPDTGVRCTTTVAPEEKPERYQAGGAPFSSEQPVLATESAEVDGWNKVEIIVKGGSATHRVNGKVVNRCADLRAQNEAGEWTSLTAGRLVFAAESSELFFRNLEIKPVWGGPLEVPRATTASARAKPFAPATLEVPEGFTVELVAGPPLVRHPMMACFDERGRLFVAESAGLNLEAGDLELVKPNSIRLLTASKGDGKFDQATTFADGMTFPMGVAWKNGSLYVPSPPYIWRFRDTQDAGSADERTQLVGKFNDSGIADSLHGTVFGPDGRLYWVHGIGGGGHEVRDRDGKLIVKSAAAGIFSCRPDGSDIRKHCAGGMNNPVELDFTDAGQMIGTVNLLWGNPRNDALVQWIWGGAYTNNEHLLKDVKRTGDLLGPTYSFGHAAVSGTVRLRSPALGAEYQNSFLVCEFNTQRVRRVRLTPLGSTYTGVGTDFIRSTNRDVHFTDVLEDADGSLLVVDTGGWFRNGCPESQIAKPEVPGAIYRIRRKEMPRLEDPRGQKIDWAKAAEADLLRLLDDERFVVRDRAADALAARGNDVVPGLGEIVTNPAAPARARLNAVWALCRLRTLAARAVVRKALADPDATVREAAVHSVVCSRDQDSGNALLPLLADPSPSVRRETATAMGILGDRWAVPGLLKALAGDNDRLLEHALIYALIEIHDRNGTLAGLADSSPRVQRAALIALDQMDDGGLTSEQVVPLLGSNDLTLERTALDVVSKHKEWAKELGERLAKSLADPSLPAERLAALRGVLLAFQSDAGTRQLVADTLTGESTPLTTRLALLDVMARSELKPWPTVWLTALEQRLRSADAREVGQAIAAVTASHERRFDRQLHALATDAARPRALRVAAAAAFAAGGGPLPAPLFTLLAEQCGVKSEPLERIAAARALATAQLDAGQRLEVARLLAQADPVLLPVLTGALEKDGDRETGLAMVTALAKAPGLMNLSTARLEHLLTAYPEEVRRAAEPLLKQLRARAEGQVERLTELRGLVLAGGNAPKGQQVFRDKRALCFTCHRIGNEGESIGPDLSRIGATRTRADLLEAIVLPSASFARGFEPYAVTTTKGTVHSGIISRQTSEAIYLRLADRSEVRIDRSEIEELAPGRESIMPQGLDRVLTVEELRDLLAYLASLDQGKP